MNDRSVQAQAADVISACTCLNLRKAARAASQSLVTYLQPLGLRAGQFGILCHISEAGCTTMTHLAETLAADRTTLTRNLRLLQREGLVEIVAGQDRRVRQISLTDHGRSVFAQALPLWAQAEAALRDRLGADRREDLLSLAATVTTLGEKLSAD